MIKSEVVDAKEFESIDDADYISKRMDSCNLNNYTKQNIRKEKKLLRRYKMKQFFAKLFKGGLDD